MKKIAMALALLLSAASCDFLDVVPEGSPTQDDIYKTQAQEIGRASCRERV